MSKDNVDVIIEDRIFQFFFDKKFQNKKDYKSFKDFTPDLKINFLIELYLYTMDNKKIIYEKEESKLEKNAELIKSNFQKILDKFKLPDYKEFIIDPRINSLGKITFQNEENKPNTIIDSLYSEKINSNFNINNNNNNFISFYTEKNLNKTFYKNDKIIPTTIYSKMNFNFDLIHNNTDNFEKKELYNLEDNYEGKQIFDFPLIKSIKNDIMEQPKITNLSTYKYSNIQNTNKTDINFHSNFFYKDYKNLTNPSMKSNINKSLQFYLNSNITNSSLTYSKNNVLITNDTKIFKKPIKKKGVIINDLVLINQSFSQESKVPFREFNGNDLIDKLFKCPSDKFITLDSIEAAKIGQIILEYMRNEKELKIVLDDLKNEIEKLNILYNEEKNKKNDTEKELNLLKTNYENKKNLIGNYIDSITKKLEVTKEEFNEIEKNYICIDEKTKQEILNEINQNLEMIN